MKRRGLHMTTILSLVLVATVLGLVLCVMALFLNVYQSALVRSATTSSRQTVAQVSSTVNNYVSDMNDMMQLLQASLEDEAVEREDFFRAFLQMRPDVICVSTYDGGGALLDCYALDQMPRENIVQNLSFDPSLLDAYAEESYSAPHVVSLFDSFYPWVVTTVAPLAAQENEEWVALDIRFSSISAYINDVGIGQRGYCFLLDTDGNIIYHPQQQLLYSNLKQEDVELIAQMSDGATVEGNVIYSVQTLENGRWRVVGVSYVRELINDSVWEVTQILSFTAAVIVIVAVASSLLLSSVLSRPIQGLAGAMRDFERDADNFTYKPVGGAREVRELSDSFGHMVIQIQQLMDTVRSEEINLRKTELRALQAQINPHFLYNTLDSIAWMCEQGRNTEAVQMVNALARLFRISISRGHELIPIRSELQHAESYLQIQSHRYKNQFRYSFKVDEACLDYLCNKITLQPIIENAIYHGINGLVDAGEICITVRFDGEDILFVVEDNGNGMEPEQVQAILSKARSDYAGIGIKNVDDRLKIYFGARYGLTIESVPDEGTQVYIRMPRVKEEAEYEKR